MTRRKKESGEAHPEEDVVAGKLTSICALYVVAYATPGPVEKVAVEFYNAVGEILEGVPVEEVAPKLEQIHGPEVLREIRDSG